LVVFNIQNKNSHIIIMSSDACKVLLAETWSEDVDPTGWWMSEKLDGVR
jgi:hypothetical protein